MELTRGWKCPRCGVAGREPRWPWRPRVYCGVACRRKANGAIERMLYHELRARRPRVRCAGVKCGVCG